MFFCSLCASENYVEMERTSNKIIIRNVPDCESYKIKMNSYLIESGICNSENDIQFFPRGISLVGNNTLYELCDACRKKLLSDEENVDDLVFIPTGIVIIETHEEKNS